MFVCVGCGTVWAVALMRCGRCRSTLRRYGSDVDDFAHPVLGRFPMRRVLSRVVATPALVVAPEVPTARSSAADWRAYALSIGVPAADAETSTKAELRALVAAGGGVG